MLQNYEMIDEPQATAFMLAQLPWTHTSSFFSLITKHKARDNRRRIERLKLDKGVLLRDGSFFLRGGGGGMTVGPFSGAWNLFYSLEKIVHVFSVGNSLWKEFFLNDTHRTWIEENTWSIFFLHGSPCTIFFSCSCRQEFVLGIAQPPSTHPSQKIIMVRPFIWNKLSL